MQKKKNIYKKKTLKFQFYGFRIAHRIIILKTRLKFFFIDKIDK